MSAQFNTGLHHPRVLEKSKWSCPTYKRELDVINNCFPFLNHRKENSKVNWSKGPFGWA